MTIKSYKKEVRWAIGLTTVMLLLNFLCYAAIHNDYDKFLSYKESLEARNKEYTDSNLEALRTQLESKMNLSFSQIMPSAFIGHKKR